MREIKFRAWDTQSKKMYYGDDVLVYGDDSFIVLNDNGEPSTGHAYLMQYTGLKDKNGVEIYEGDILRQEYGFDDAPYIYRTIRIGKSLDERMGVYFDSPDRPDGVGLSVSDDEINYYEVCGNIYENPELLK